MTLVDTNVISDILSANPEWLTLIVHVAYLVIVLALYLRPLPPRQAPAQPAPQASSS